MPKRQSLAGVHILHSKRKWSEYELWTWDWWRTSLNFKGKPYDTTTEWIDWNINLNFSLPFSPLSMYYLIIPFVFSFFSFFFFVFSSLTSSMTVKIMVQHTGDSSSSLCNAEKRYKQKTNGLFILTKTNRSHTDLPFEYLQWMLQCRQWKKGCQRIPHEALAPAHFYNDLLTKKWTLIWSNVWLILISYRLTVDDVEAGVCSTIHDIRRRNVTETVHNQSHSNSYFYFVLLVDP